MSIVAVRIYEKYYEIASDSIVTRGATKNNNSTKLFEENGLVVGSCGLVRDTGLFRLFLKTHKPLDSTQEAMLELFSEFSDWLKNKTENYGTENIFFIGYKNKIFEFNDFFIEEIKDYEAIGAGRDFALGVLYHGGSVDKAVESAIKHSVYCEAPVVFIRKFYD